ncbi:hypothetical protein JRG66_04005 [Salinimicrobium tongyeongense]|uniref:Uncharacterized protein n=1 Tax=Salinimicrobium tongyeongense TaxID=2809707 RepID=A0ABY6NU12_9FLAO|nr:hypothetical protein [Salinimicrobium tongyeongense]UZH56043.1 hypothetical protein JRG66_04005 [Salinimicrobium tongyeongense]
MTNLSPGEALLLIVDAYNIEDKKARKNFRNKNYKNPFYDNYSEVLKAIQERNEKADLDAFIYHLGFLRSQGTLHRLSEKDYLQEQFEAFKIDVPEWVKNCFEEIEFRTSCNERFIQKEEYKWKQEQIKAYKEELEQELQEFTLNTSTSRAEYLKKKFNSTSEEIRKTESHFRKIYKYDISNIYKNNKFTATKEDLNNIYFFAEKEAGTINEFWNIHKLLKKYFDLKNQLPILKEEINFNFPQVEKETKPVEENIWFKIGLTFATGKAQKIYKDCKNYSEVARKLGFDSSYRNYFARTFANSEKVTDNKNIYSQPDKLKEIYQYCQKYDIEVAEDFKKQLTKTT